MTAAIAFGMFMVLAGFIAGVVFGARDLRRDKQQIERDALFRAVRSIKGVHDDEHLRLLSKDIDLLLRERESASRRQEAGSGPSFSGAY